MRVIKCNLPEDITEAQIHVVADLHIGDANCDHKLISQRLAAIRDNPSAYAIINGDIINNATTASVSDSYAEGLTPMEQMHMAVEVLEPIKDKILCINPGNHEHRTYRSDGVDLTEIVSRELGLIDRYSTESTTLFVRVGSERRKRKRQDAYKNKVRQVRYVLYATHGSGGGRRPGSKINRLDDLERIVDADIYIHSHTHMPGAIKQGFNRTDIINSKVRVVEKLFVNTGATLNWGGYSERFNYRPASKANPVIYLDGTKKDMWAVV